MVERIQLFNDVLTSVDEALVAIRFAGGKRRLYVPKRTLGVIAVK